MAKNTPRVQICTPGVNLHPGANCAHERGFRGFDSVSDTTINLFGNIMLKSVKFHFSLSTNI